MSSVLGLDKEHSDRVIKKLKKPDQAGHLLFRLLGPKFQKNFQELIDLENPPCLFIHGNPHIDNYARTLTGAGMIDFDRSRVGPYCWDIIRFLSSLKLRSESSDDKWLSKEVSESFQRGYLRSFTNPDLYYTMPLFLKSIVPKETELTTKAFVDADLGWAKKMRKEPLDIKDKWVTETLNLYLSARKETFLMEDYLLVEAGTSAGSLGKKHYLFLLAPKSDDLNKDHILIDVKETYTEEDDDWFKNPSEHHGERMIKASNLYAPGVEQRLSYFTLDGVEYWGREIPSFKVKIKKLLNQSEQSELAYCVGSQLGRGHRRSYRDGRPQDVIDHLKAHYVHFQNLSKFLNDEVQLGLEYIVKTEELRSSLGT